MLLYYSVVKEKICAEPKVQKYPSGSRGSPAKGVVRETVARVQIPPSAPKRPESNLFDSGLFFIDTDFTCFAWNEKVPQVQFLKLRKFLISFSNLY